MRRAGKASHCLEAQAAVASEEVWPRFARTCILDAGLSTERTEFSAAG
jgi:hypothetical protein